MLIQSQFDIICFWLQNETIVGSINNKYIQQFEEYFVEGNIILITDFEVWKTIENYKISNHRFQLRINDQSTIEIINDAEVSIENEKFEFFNYDQFRLIANSNKQFNGWFLHISHKIETYINPICLVNGLLYYRCNRCHRRRRNVEFRKH